MAGPSSIGPSTTIRGNLKGDGALDVFGSVQGTISVGGELTIGEGARVTGDVSGTEVKIAGTVDGDVSGERAIALEATARVTGSISAPRVSIAPGASIHGMVRTDGRAAPARPPAYEPPRAEPSPREVHEEARAYSFRDEVPVREPLEVRPIQPLRQPPAPVIPTLRKGAKGRKKPSHRDL
jgi:cytoskeletal protein CcmA (bactofilin family)